MGYSIARVEGGLGGEPFGDMAYFLPDDRPLVFDVGANVGQSIRNFRISFRNAQIHSFEPSPSSFKLLKSNAGRFPNVHLWNLALGAAAGQLPLLENTMSEWTSFLPLSNSSRGSVTQQTQVPITTIDNFCQEHGINHVDILKSDTQGYELEVFKGAQQMFSKSAVRLVYCELIFSDLYKNMPSFGQVYDYLTSRGFLLVSFYSIAYEKRLASWTDGLFVHKSYLPS
jgi:FkbM family methyltransferase